MYFKQVLASAMLSASRLPQAKELPYPEYPAYLSRVWRADERTRTADLLITSLLACVLADPTVSGNRAHLGRFRCFGGVALSIVYQCVSARLQYVL
jgi:hypothetical protein